MVLGLRKKSRKGILFKVDYIVHVQEIKPWPPSQSLRSVQSVVLQWENGDQASGFLSCSIGNGRIEFKEPFKLPVAFYKDGKSRGSESFHKNFLDFNLYEPRKDKVGKAQILGSAVINLADYGIIEEAITISTPLNCKRSHRNVAQPVVYLKIQPFGKASSGSSPAVSSSKEASLDQEGGESVSELMCEENNEEEVKIAPFTDDDDDDYGAASSHSSSHTFSSSTFETNGCSPAQVVENRLGSAKDSMGRNNEEPGPILGPAPAKPEANSVPDASKNLNGSSSLLLPTGLLTKPGGPVNDEASFSDCSKKSSISSPEETIIRHVQSSSLFGSQGKKEESSSSAKFEHTLIIDENFADRETKILGTTEECRRSNFTDNLATKVATLGTKVQVGINSDLVGSVESQTDGTDDEKLPMLNKNDQVDPRTVDDLWVDLQEDKEEKKQEESEHEEQNLEKKKHSSENELVSKFTQDVTRKKPALRSNTLAFDSRVSEMEGKLETNHQLKHMKSIQLSSESVKPGGLFDCNPIMEKVKEIDVQGDSHKDAELFTGSEKSNTIAFNDIVPGMQESLETDHQVKHMKSIQLSSERAKPEGLCDSNPLVEKVKEIAVPDDSHKDAEDLAASERKERVHEFSDSKDEVDSRIEMLEEELREAAAIEVGLYSVVVEHGSSSYKVHAPARRISRFYLHACRAGAPAKRASAARAAASGLVLVAKACGNDVPRLTFWLSNSIVLRAIVSQAIVEMPLSAGHSSSSGGGRNGYNEKEKSAIESSDDWENPQTFIVVLENVEAWIFSRIIESVWWQTLTPYMQSTAAKTSDGGRASNAMKTYGRRHSLGGEEQVNFSVELWKRAFKDACERLCPTRAGGHECGCLPVLSRLVMEQLVHRLDVGMFNAILRESAEEMPTDPVSDPISDSKVLPVPAGKSSFGAGAQLKNAVGNWSRWLTDLFGIDDNDSPEGTNEVGDGERSKCETSFKVFHILKGLSDLMMLPFEMLTEKSTRKEVCPNFGVPIIRRVLNNFVPDEFCPDPIPDSIFEALDYEDPLEGGEESITSLPCIATPPVYSPPSAASFTSIIGEVGSQSLQRNVSLLRKSYASDDELDELDSPITSIIGDSIRGTPTLTKPSWLPKGIGGRDIVRYRLLREVWRDGE